VNIVGVALGVSARALPVARKHVDPPLVERLRDNALVFAPERRQRLDDDGFGFLGCVGSIHRGDQRRVEVEVVQLVDAEHPLPQRQETVKEGDVPVDAFDQPVVDRYRHVVRVESVLQRGAILPRFRIEQDLLDQPVHHRAEGPPVLAKG
jgi:hypothetical protein